MNAFLGADARLECERLANWLTVISTGAQGSSDSIRQLGRELRHITDAKNQPDR